MFLEVAILLLEIINLTLQSSIGFDRQIHLFQQLFVLLFLLFHFFNKCGELGLQRLELRMLLNVYARRVLHRLDVIYLFFLGVQH